MDDCDVQPDGFKHLVDGRDIFRLSRRHWIIPSSERHFGRPCRCLNYGRGGTGAIRLGASSKDQAKFGQSR